MLLYDWKKKRLDFVQKLDYATKPESTRAQHGVAVNRFAHEIPAFLKSSCVARSRQLKARPLGRSSHISLSQRAVPNIWDMSQKRVTPAS
jgi:hypothetical protein